MLIDWSRFLPALLFLLPPIALFHGKRIHYRAIMRDWDGYWKRTFLLGLHSIDFGRAMLGAWWLHDAVQASADAQGLMRYLPFIVKGVVMVIATALQAFVCKEPEAAHAPFAFVAGLTIGFLPPLVSGFTLFLAIAIACGAHSPAAFFPMLSLGVAGLGFLFTQKKIAYDIIVMFVVPASPWVLTLLFPRHFVVSCLAKPALPPRPPAPSPQP